MANKFHIGNAISYFGISRLKGSVIDIFNDNQSLCNALGFFQYNFGIGRIRLEQRFFEGQSDNAIRFRQQLRLTAPINDKVKAVFYTESFIGFTSNDVQDDGVNLWRNFAGINIPISKNISIEPGHLNQYVVRDGADYIDHVAVIAIGMKF